MLNLYSVRLSNIYTNNAVATCGGVPALYQNREKPRRLDERVEAKDPTSNTGQEAENQYREKGLGNQLDRSI